MFDKEIREALEVSPRFVGHSLSHVIHGQNSLGCGVSRIRVASSLSVHCLRHVSALYPRPEAQALASCEINATDSSCRQESVLRLPDCATCVKSYTPSRLPPISSL